MKKRLKIAEQILVVLSLALIIPLVVAAAIIINTNQIAVRKELASSATIIANSIADKILVLENFEKYNISTSYEVIDKLESNGSKSKFINYLKNHDNGILSLTVTQLSRKQVVPEKFSTKYLPDKKIIIFNLVNEDNTLVTKTVSLDYFKNRLLADFNPQGREIYIFDKNKNAIMSLNTEPEKIKDVLYNFPDINEIEADDPILYTKYKNQPNILIKVNDLDWYVVVASPKNLTDYGIIDAKYKIILAICLAAITVFVFFGIYTYSLYTNIRQFFKVIRAIAEGNYTKKLRFLTNIFTSQEIIFISQEFNKMLAKIDDSYRKLHESNKKLKKMDEYKSNLIDTVSHEFRTPLTSIKGYASSLLRHDIHIDDETRKKSLKIIKNQAERLSRMVEDLLVIPDIESATLRMNYEELNLKNVIETSVLYTSKADTSIFNVNIPEEIKNIYADEDRVIQIFVNLLENAIKYSKEGSLINVSVSYDNDFAIISVQNEAEYIENETINQLFEKFTRVDSNLTRTTRGTGLGLFIVKGLVETMGGTISLNSNNGFEVIFTLPLYK